MKMSADLITRWTTGLPVPTLTSSNSSFDSSVQYSS